MISSTFIKKNFSKLQKASMTIELSFLMPLILSVFVLLLYAAAFLYNRETAESIVCIGIHKGLQMEHDTKAAVRQTVESYVAEQLDQRLLLSPDTTYRVEAGMMTIKVSVEVRQKLPLAGLSPLLLQNRLFCASISRKASRIDPAKVLWVMKK